MRPVLLLSLTVGVLVAGCRTEGEESAAVARPGRDLALPAHAPAVEIASPVELGHLRVQRAALHTRRTAQRASARPYSPVPVKLVSTTAIAAPAVALAPAEPAAIPTSSNDAHNDRELPPGKTVTLIPASTGPSAGSDGIDELPPSKGRTMVGGGGTCRGRGRGRGPDIGAAPRPDFR